MKKHLYRIRFLFLIILFSAYSYSQNYPTTIINGKEFFLYEVQKSEGLFRISTKLGISQEEITSYNPEISSGLREGQILRIPVSKTQRKESDTIFTSHTVEKGQTLYSIAKVYNVQVETIIKYNPEVEKGLKIGDLLHIPTESSQKQEAIKPKENSSSNNKPTITDTKKNTPESSGKNRIKIALLLPFMLNADKQDATIDKFIEFYEGCLIAVNKLKNEGLSIDLYTFDTEKSETKIYELIENDLLKKMDLIIGPAYSNQVNIMTDYALKNKINLVIPFSPRIDDIGNNPYIFQNNSPQKIRFEQTAKGFANQFKNKNIIILKFNNDANDEGSEFAKYLSSYLKKQQINYHDILHKPENPAGFSSFLSANKENILLPASDNPSIIQDMTTIVNTLNTTTTPLSVFGFSNWQSLLKSFLDVYVCSPFSINPMNEETKKYNQEFGNWFGHEITTSFPRFDMMGYDITLYFSEAMRKYGKNIGPMLPSHTIKTIQSDFSFQKQNGGGYINQRFWFIRYNQEKGVEKIRIQ